MLKSKSIIVSLLIAILLTGCSSEEDKFIKQCIDDAMTIAKNNNLENDKVMLALNCNNDNDLDVLIESASYSEKVGFHKSCLTNDQANTPFYKSKMAPQDILVDGERFSCMRCTPSERQPDCTDIKLAACWKADQDKCEEKKTELRSSFKNQCISSQKEIKSNGLGKIKTDEKIFREMCLRQIRG